MASRARAIPLAVLVGIVAVLVGLRVREARLRRAISATRVTNAAAAAAGRPSIARAVEPRDAGESASAPLMVHGDPRHTGRASAVGPRAAHVAWTTRIGAPIEAQVIASPDERTLYVAALDGSFTALDAKTGARSFSLSLGGRAYSTPCVSRDSPPLIYVGSDARWFYAITPAGAVAWKLEVGGDADTGAVITPDKLVVFAAGPSVYAVRSGLAGGDVAWRFDAKKKVYTSPALTPGGNVVFGSQDHHVYAVTSKGDLAWTTDVGADVDGTPVIADDGSIFVGTDGGEVVHLQASGEVVWRAQVGGYVRGALSLARNGDVLAGVYGPSPGVVRVTPHGTVYATFAVPGTGAREFGVHGAPLEDETGALFFGAQDDVARGEGPGGSWEWSFPTGGDVDAPLTLLSSGALVVPSDDGNVVLFAP